MRRYDFVAIGGGNAGLTAAARVAAAGRRTALIDRGPVGGLCSLAGCNPKKVLVRSSEVLDEARHAARFGVTTGAAAVDWSKVMARRASFTAEVTAATEQSLREQGIELLRGAPRFVGPDRLVLDGEEIQADAVLVATGSTPRRFDFPGADLVRISDDLLALDAVPADLVIVGGGVIAFELGQVYARVGARVTVLTPGRALSGLDEDLVDALVGFSAGLGITVVTGAAVQGVHRDGARLRVEYKSADRAGAVAADVVLNAAGRVPSIDDLALERAGVTHDRRGVTVTEYLRSPSNPRVFAAGDAHGLRQLSPVASYEGRVAARNLLEGDVEPVDHGATPAVVFTIPPFAAVGLTEAEARRRGLDVRVVASDMTAWKVFAIAGEPIARAKVVLDAATSRILGAHILGAGAGDVINVFAMAIRGGLGADDLRRMIFTYPTFSSAIPHMVG